MATITMTARVFVLALGLFLLAAPGCGGDAGESRHDSGSDHPAGDAGPDQDGGDARPGADGPLPGDGGVPPANTSSLGTNLDGLADWSSVYPFVDAFKMARAWISGSSSQWDDGRALALDADGWVTSLQSDQVARTLMFTELNDHYPGGRYVVLYEGEGTIEYSNAATKDAAASAPGRDVLDVDASGGFVGLTITATTPSNYLRNLRVIMPGFEATYATQVFHPDFLQAASAYKVLRFMDWMATNNSAQVTWAERPQPSHAVYTVRGAPVEVMVELANRLGADPWFCLPHQADDDYVTRFATYVRDHLGAGLRAYVEYSNEVWNGMFEQAGYASQQGQALGLSTNAYEAQLRYYSRRAVQVFDLWTAAFGGSDRLVRVMAAQSANSWTATTALDYENAAATTDALAIAPYFGGGYGSPANAAATLALGTAGLLDDLRDTELPQIVTAIADNAAVAHDRGVDLIAYEGGQHLVGIQGQENDDALNALFDAVNQDPAMKTLYLDYLAAWKDHGGGLFAHFVDTGRWSKWGRWGARRYLDETRAQMPKYDALVTFIEQTPRWW